MAGLVQWPSGKASDRTRLLEFNSRLNTFSIISFVARFLFPSYTTIPVGICVSFVGFIFFRFFFSVSVKVLPVTLLLSGVFVRYRVFCAYFLRIERVVGNA